MAALTAGTLAACSDDPTAAVEIGDLPADVGPAIDLGVELDEWGTFSDWPSACDLVTDETLQALLPQTTAITRETEAVTYEFQGRDLVEIPGGITVDDAICHLDLAIPVGMLESGQPASLRVEVQMAGSPEMVDLNADPNITSELELEGGTCGRSTFGISCVNATGQISVLVTFELPHHGPSLKDPSRYVHDGEEVSFTTSDEDTAPRTEYIDEHLTHPIVESILSRLQG